MKASLGSVVLLAGIWRNFVVETVLKLIFLGRFDRL
jgi:hypothetical protein